MRPFHSLVGRRINAMCDVPKCEVITDENCGPDVDWLRSLSELNCSSRAAED